MWIWFKIKDKDLHNQFPRHRFRLTDIYPEILCSRNLESDISKISEVSLSSKELFDLDDDHQYRHQK